MQLLLSRISGFLLVHAFEVLYSGLAIYKLDAKTHFLKYLLIISQKSASISTAIKLELPKPSSTKIYASTFTFEVGIVRRHQLPSFGAFKEKLLFMWRSWSDANPIRYPFQADCFCSNFFCYISHSTKYYWGLLMYVENMCSFNCWCAHMSCSCLCVQPLFVSPCYASAVWKLEFSKRRLLLLGFCVINDELRK